MKRPMSMWVAAMTVAAMAGSAFGFTAISAPSGGELGHQSIIQGVYGLSVSQAGDGVSWAGANFTATRIADTGGSAALALLQPDAAAGPFDDQSWHNGVVSFTAEAKYAAYNQTFGFAYDAGGAWQELFRASGSGLSLTTNATGAGTQFGPAVVANFTSAPLHWVRAGDGGSWTNNVVSSRISDNASQRDQMVTYLIQDTRGGAVVGTTWLVFFEDQLSGDWDYNDLAVEFQIRGTGAVIPEPVTMLSLFGGLVGLGRYVRRRTV